MALSGTKALLSWSQRTTKGYRDVSVTNMSKSWKDGLAFCAILHHFRPDLIDFNSLSKENVHENNKLAFDVAEQELGIPALLDPDDMATMHSPDKLSIMTYVSQYYSYFKNKTPVKDVGEQKARVASKRSAGEAPLQHTPSKQPSMGVLCAICDKKVYLVERQVADGKLYHRNCFRCTKCSTTLRQGGYKTTANPRKLECLEHGDNIWKLRSDIASRASKEKKPSADGGIWETRPASDASSAGSPWEKQAETKPAPNARPVLRDSVGVASLWEARAGLKSVTSDGSSKEDLRPSQGRPAVPAQKPTIPGGPGKPSPAPNKPVVPMHPHLLAGKASRERFNNPAAAHESKIIQPSHPSPSSVSSPSLGSPEEKVNDDTAKTEVTRQGLLASLAAIQGNLKLGKAASKDNLHDVLEGITGQKLAEGEGDSRETSPSGSNWSLLSDAKESPKDPDEEGGEQKLEHSEESEKPSPEPSETKDKSAPSNADSQSRDSSHTSSDGFSIASLSSISQKGNSETSSLDAEHATFASGIEPWKRSSGFSRASFTDQEGVTGTTLNLSDSFCVKYRADKIEDGSASGASAEDDEPVDAKTDSTKEDEGPVSEAPVVEKDGSKPEKKKPDDYDKTLNPFGDDDEEEEEVKKEDDGYKNPFDESDEDEHNDIYDDSLNPFGDDSLNPFGGDDDDKTPGSPITQWPPPPSAVGPKQQEIPNQQSCYKVKTRQEILQEMHRDRHTLKQKKSQKRHAPPRPENAPPRPYSSYDQAASSHPNQGDAIRSPLRARKSRHAPAPPKENGQQVEAKKDLKHHRPDRPPPPAPNQRTYSDVGSYPVPSLRLKKTALLNKENDERISPVPSPRRKVSDGLKVDGRASPVPSPRMRRATAGNLDQKMVRPPRPTSSPIKAAVPPLHCSRKRAPAPPPIKRAVNKHHIDPSVIQKELVDIESQQREMEAKGVKLEEIVRTAMEETGHDSHDNEDLLVEWFALVNERNQLLRREGELVAQAQMQDLELQQAEIEYELRCLMHKHEHQKTDADVEREETLLEMLVEAVTKRSQVVERLEDDRKREEAEDEDIQTMMEQSVPQKEKGTGKKGLDKKDAGKKKQKKKKAMMGK